MPTSHANKPSRHRPRSCLRRRLAWLLALPLLLILGYLAVANWLLNSDWAQDRLAEHNDLSLRWGSGWSWLPGRLEVESLRLQREDAGPALLLEAAQAELEVSLLALLTGRLMIDTFTADKLGTLAYGVHRLEGEGSGRVELSGLSLAQGQLAIERLALRLDEAEVQRGNAVLASDIRLDAELQLAPFRPGDTSGMALTRFLSGDLSLEASADAWDVFEPYLRELDWLALAGHGDLSGQLRIEQGVLAPGSELVLDSPSLWVELDERRLLSPPGHQQTDEIRWTVANEAPESHRLIGAGRIISRVESGDHGPTATLAVILDDMTMQRAGLPGDFMTSERFALYARLPGADLAGAPRRLESARLEWKGARLPDVGQLSHYLPEGGPLSLQSGSARLEGKLNYRDDALDGHFRLAGNEVDLTLLGQPLLGELTLDLALAELDPQKRRLDLSGTRLKVSARGEVDTLPLTTELTLEDARLETTEPLANLVGTSGPPALDGRIALRGHIGHLSVLDDFLVDAVNGHGLRLEGGGELAASLQVSGGRVTSGSQLAVETDSLRVSVLDLAAWGQGSLTATWLDTLQGPQARLEAHLEDSQVARLSDSQLLMRGGRLNLIAESREFSLTAPLASPRISLNWQDAEMPDITALQAYIPPAASVELLSGQAATTGRIVTEAGLLRGRLELTGRRIATRVMEESLVSELDLDLVIREGQLDGSQLDLTGTRLNMQAAEASSMGEERLQTLIIARRARVGPLSLPGQTDPATGLNGRLELEGMVANLGMLDAFLPEVHGLTLQGSGRFRADMRLADDHLLPESSLRVEADDLAVGFLDFNAEGRGTLEAVFDGDDQTPGARLDLTLPHFALRRQDEQDAYVTGRHFHLETHTSRFGIDAEARSLDHFTTRIRLPIAEVADLSRYNAYLPDDAGIELLDGRANLEVDLRLEGKQARGEITLQAFGAALRLGEQQLSGDLRLDAQLRDGNLTHRRFDASGSQLRLDNVQRRDTDSQEVGWWARLTLIDGRLEWTRPLKLEARVDMAMRDSGLLIRLFLARAREWAWLGRRLTIKDLRGVADLRLGDDTLQLRDARLSGGELEMLADLIFRDEAIDGALYARLGVLAAGVALDNGDPRVRLLQPRQWYEANRPPEAAALELTLDKATPRKWQEALDTRP
ncbi:hypothetical protein KG088_08210 [Halomonas sp. TRM85114]|uniref:hypothetical protein n=1 Tax=Halomonas jincaotanensis TaxID=2810616 RepID=UPI001BD32C0C|nr:hypothetical protein [Halomonas jincaotanensis]MBS9403611.1 hypothetical protein [Halomonas jincaotanensis]